MTRFASVRALKVRVFRPRAYWDHDGVRLGTVKYGYVQNRGSGPVKIKKGPPGEVGHKSDEEQKPLREEEVSV
jgi:hypothetical protein